MINLKNNRSSDVRSFSLSSNGSSRKQISRRVCVDNVVISCMNHTLNCNSVKGENKLKNILTVYGKKIIKKSTTWIIKKILSVNKKRVLPAFIYEHCHLLAVTLKFLQPTINVMSSSFSISDISHKYLISSFLMNDGGGGVKKKTYLFD